MGLNDGNKVQIVLALKDETTGELKEAEAQFKASITGMKTSASGLDEIASRFSYLIGPAALGGMVVAATKAGMEWERTIFQMRKTFGAESDAMLAKAAEMSSRMNNYFSQTEINYAFTKTADSMRRYGIDGQKYLDLVARASDVAAAKGLEVKESIDRIESAIRGEAEASEYLGLTLNDTYMKNMAFNGALKGTWEKLTDNEKALHRFNELMNQSSKYQGAAAEASKSFGGHLQSWWNWFKDDFSKGMANANKTLGEFIDKMEKVGKGKEGGSSPGTSAAGALGAVHGDWGDDPYGVRAVVEAQNRVNWTLAAMEKIGTENTVKQYKAVEDQIRSTQAELDRLYRAKKKFADEDFYELTGDERSNLNYKPTLETAADIEQRLKQLRGDSKNLTNDIVGLETERVRLLKEMDGMDLDVDMDSYIAARDRVREIDDSLVIWQEQLEKVKADMDQVTEARTAKIDADISAAEAKVQTLQDQYWTLYRDIPLNVDPAPALAAIEAVREQLLQLQALNRMIFTIGFYASASPVKPFSETYSNILDKLGSIPGGMKYQIDFLMGAGDMNASSAAGLAQEYAKLQKAQASLSAAYRELDAYKHSYNGLTFGSPAMESYYENTVIPKLKADVNAINATLMANMAGALGTGGGSSYSTGSGGTSNNSVNINTVNISVEGTGNARSDGQTIAIEFDSTVANLIKNKQSKIPAALEAASK